MQIDYSLIRRVLNIMYERDSHYISVRALFELSRPEYSSVENDEYIDLLYGHLHILKDNNVIVEVFGSNLGAGYTSNGLTQINSCYIRLTSKGYDFLKALNKNGIIERLKRATLTEAMKISETVLIDSVSQYIGNL